MKSLNLNAYGVSEMSMIELQSIEGGSLIAVACCACAFALGLALAFRIL